MILIYANAISDAAIHGDASAAFRAAHGELVHELSASGELVDTHELLVDGARIVRTSDGVSITDGPYAGSMEWVSGYYLVDVVDEARALGIAARFVEARFATVEVRRLG